ncbi:hypothetical protein [Amycolatopsis suaedae]|uniref:Uncharacterized protein n=1 Tax=Amycolatopsis suaedae TaxID=2510978 RepID=A0A4Q7J024_9PSEU|nr:hypothetical protein [Amycolatopsis suaedae]RZQ60129.1 hypothetical protein EWH70_31000 [Amycolatopsis suaedae]
MTRAPAPYTDKPVPGWDSEYIDKDVRNTVHDFACWINYLLNPSDHDGPRRYVCGGQEGCGFYYDSTRKRNEAELDHFHNISQTHGEAARWELRSVLQDLKVPSLFHAIHAFCGMLWHEHSTMGDAFRALTDGELCKSHLRISSGKSLLYDHDMSFCKFRAAMEVIPGLGGEDPRHATCLYYQRSIVIHAERLENQAILLAEALGRYRGCFEGSRNKVKSLMQRTTEIFAAIDEGGLAIDISGWDIANAVLGSLLALPLTATTGAVGATIVGTITSLIAGEIIEEFQGSVEVERADWLRAPPGLGSANRAHWFEIVNPLIDAFDRAGNELFDMIDVNNQNGIAQDTERKLSKLIQETSQGSPIPKSPSEVGVVIVDSHFLCDRASVCGNYMELVKEYENAGIDAGIEPGRD